MKKIYAPWRADYVSDVAHTKKGDAKKGDCIFCHEFSENNDEKYFILKRTKNIITMLNLYPYNAGHILILPIVHEAKLEKLSSEVRTELMETLSNSLEILQKELTSDGFNVGMNLGKAGGAGIPSHLHIHIVPRWTGDTNFLPVIGETKAVSFDLVKMYQQLKKAFS